jgi:tetratricopeptide (TPR) repeat protein
MDSDAAGRLAYADGNLELALDRFKEEIARRPSDAASYNNAGQVLVRMGQPSAALTYLLKAVSLDENRWAYRFNLARCRGLLGEWDLAVTEYVAANRLYPDDYPTLFNLAQALHRSGREDEAVTRYREAIGHRPGDATFHLALGISEERLGHGAAAAAAYRRFLQLTPQAREAESVRARADLLERSVSGAPVAGAPVAANDD